MIDTVGLLRGMNVGGHRLTNERLVQIIEGLGLSDVAAFQASGNVLFAAEGRSAGALENLIAEGLAEALGYPVPTTVRTADEIRNALAAEPHRDATSEPLGKQQIAFFTRPPAAPDITKIEALAPVNDQLAIVGREMYWWPDGGISESEIDLAAIEKIAGLLTMRTRGTVERIAKRLPEA